MDKEIKFRGIRRDNNEWIVGHLVYGTSQSFIIPIGNIMMGAKLGVDSINSVCHNVKPETVGQFTGLKDKNDVYIYEGDICQFTYDDIIKKLVVVWADYLMMWKFTESLDGPLYRSSRTITNSETLKVIGNIHQDSHLLLDNPELLESK